MDLSKDDYLDFALAIVAVATASRTPGLAAYADSERRLIASFERIAGEPASEGTRRAVRGLSHGASALVQQVALGRLEGIDLSLQDAAKKLAAQEG